MRIPERSRELVLADDPQRADRRTDRSLAGKAVGKDHVRRERIAQDVDIREPADDVHQTIRRFARLKELDFVAHVVNEVESLPVLYDRVLAGDDLVVRMPVLPPLAGKPVRDPYEFPGVPLIPIDRPFLYRVVEARRSKHVLNLLLSSYTCSDVFPCCGSHVFPPFLA